MTSEKDVLKQAKTVKEKTVKSNDRAKRWNTVLLIKLNINLSLCSSNSTLRYLPERNENIRPQKDTYSIMTFQSTTDHIYNGDPIRL